MGLCVGNKKRYIEKLPNSKNEDQRKYLAFKPIFHNYK